SMRRVAHRPEGSGFFLITAGTAVANGAELLDGPRWPALCTGFREAGVTLAALVPAKDPCLDAVLAQAAAAVVLASATEDMPLAVGERSIPILAVVGRETAAPAAAGPELAAVPVPEAGRVEESIPTESAQEADVEEPEAPAPKDSPQPGPHFGTEELPAGHQPAVRPSSELPQDTPGLEPPTGAEPLVPGVGEPPAQVAEPVASPVPLTQADEAQKGEPQPVPALREPAPIRPAAFARRVPTFEEIVKESGPAGAPSRTFDRRALAAISLLIIIVVGVVAGALLGYLHIPGLTPDEQGPAEPSGSATAQSAMAAAPSTSEPSELAPYSVGLAAFQDEASALAMARELSGKVRGVIFTTAPVEMGGKVLHRVLAGPASDSAAALALGARIAEAAGIGPGDWVARWPPRAFLLGESPDALGAVRRSEELAGLGVPSYVLAVTHPDGSVRFRVYAGAYADEAEGAYLSGLLAERGLSGATLSDRIGRLPE
ncbi:MAG: hypothetical protein FIA95_04120, partial [Gemmatimonadetes bacterium]|nr:hypothetical protein [Gemmatimonadota bacterium]